MTIEPSEVVTSSAKRIGLVAGWGSFPVEVAEKCKRDGAKLFVVGLTGHADPRLQEIADEFRWMGVAKLGGHIRFFKRHSVDQVALAGKLFKDRLLFHGLGWMGLLPDWTCIKALGSIFINRTQNACDDSILSCVVNAYQQRGISMLAVSGLAPKLLVEPGLIAGKYPTRRVLNDIAFGWQIARQMGGLDIGQSIIVKDQVVLSVEAVEGTDALIERTGKLCPRGGFNLIKVAKPNQDMRFDVPTIGPRTIRQMSAAGGSVVAIEAGMTILVERDETIATAERLGVAIIALDDAQVAAINAESAKVA